MIQITNNCQNIAENSKWILLGIVIIAAKIFKLHSFLKKIYILRTSIFKKIYFKIFIYIQTNKACSRFTILMKISRDQDFKITFLHFNYAYQNGSKNCLTFYILSTNK